MDGVEQRHVQGRDNGGQRGDLRGPQRGQRADPAQRCEGGERAAVIKRRSRTNTKWVSEKVSKTEVTAEVKEVGSAV